MDSQYDFYKHTHVGSEPKTSEINGNLFYFHAFLIRLSAVHFTRYETIYKANLCPFFSKVYMLCSI